MKIHRHLLGWDAPVTDKVRGYLVPEGHEGPLRLDDTLVVAPTRQAGRRLREHMAHWCTDQGIALLSFRVKTPNFFLLGTEIPPNLATPTDILHAWTRVLREIEVTDYPALFPSGVTDPDMHWAVSMGRRLHKLRDQLLEGGLTITQAARSLDAQADEKARWLDLLKLEQAYLSILRDKERIDPCAHKIELSPDRMLPEGVKRIVLACIADPTPLMIRQLEELGASGTAINLEILIHGDPAHADHFDDWGRPLTEAWKEMHIPFPSDDHLILAADPAAQSRRVLQIIHAHAPAIGPQDVAIGAPDGDVIPQLAAAMDEQGLPAFNPAGISVRSHTLFQLLDAWQALLSERSYLAFRDLIRHPAILHYLETKEIPSGPLLEQADRYQNRFLPQLLGDLKRGGESFERFHEAVDLLVAQVDIYLGQPDTETALRTLLMELYAERELHDNDRSDEAFREVAQLLDHQLNEFRECLSEPATWKADEALHLFLERFGSESWYGEQADTVIDLDGWLELSWNDAPLMIITGMNDQSVPDGRISDLFLPDSLRSHLHLRNAEDRFARDVYLSSSFIHSRSHNQGEINFICGKVNSRGEPLRPSRLLMRCPDEALAPRTRKLFGDAPEQADNIPVSIAFKLDPSRIAVSAEQTEMHVTAFSDYLSCPFRYYLKHVLGMRNLDDGFTELPQSEFGTLVHEALNYMGRHPELAQSTDPRALAEALIERLNRNFARFGSTLPLPVQFQRDSAHERLRAAARIQVGLAHEGWRIVACEKSFERSLNGVTIVGKIDRIDYHDTRKCYRILDYKTMDQSQAPEALHIGGKGLDSSEYSWLEGRHAWHDLQLPLYRFLLEEAYPDAELRFGIFNLPKAVLNTGIHEWVEFNDVLYQSALGCASGVLEDIAGQHFWPPRLKTRYDDFKSIFFEQPEAYAEILKLAPRASDA